MLVEVWSGKLVGGMEKWDEAIKLGKRHGEAIRKHRLVLHSWTLRPTTGAMNRVEGWLAFKSMADRQEFYRTVVQEVPEFLTTRQAMNACPYIDQNSWEMHQYYEP